MWKKLLNSFLIWYRGYETDPIKEATQQRLGKDSKIQTGLNAVLVDDLYKIAKSERAAVARYRDNKLFGGQSTKPTEDEGMIIADDIRINNIKSGGFAQSLAMLALGGAAAYYGIPYLADYLSSVNKKSQSTVVIERVETDYDFDLETRIIPPKDSRN